MKIKSWYVYIIKAQNGNYYTGITTDVKRRFLEHKSKKNGAKFFRFTTPSKVVYKETLKNRGDALRREWAIKKMSRSKKLELISGNSYTTRDNKI